MSRQHSVTRSGIGHNKLSPAEMNSVGLICVFLQKIRNKNTYSTSFFCVFSFNKSHSSTFIYELPIGKSYSSALLCVFSFDESHSSPLFYVFPFDKARSSAHFYVFQTGESRSREHYLSKTAITTPTH